MPTSPASVLCRRTPQRDQPSRAPDAQSGHRGDYDAKDQLTRTQVGTGTELSHTYDANGNSTAAQPSVLNRVLRDGNYELTYDNEGNLTQRLPLNTDPSRFAQSDPDTSSTAQKQTDGWHDGDLFVLNTPSSSLQFTLQIPDSSSAMFSYKPIEAGPYVLEIAYPQVSGEALTHAARFSMFRA